MGYKFNAGSEKDDEIFIGAYTAEYWEYDSRLGRRWNVDLLTYEWQSSYTAFNNNPIYLVHADVSSVCSKTKYIVK